MALASQSARPSRIAGPGATPPRAGRDWLGGRGPGRTVAVAILAMAALAGAIWGLNRISGGPKTATAAGDTAPPPADPSAAPTGSLTAHPTDTPASSLVGGGGKKPVQPQPPATPPVVMDMNVNRRVDPPTPPSPAPSSPQAPTSGGAPSSTAPPPAPSASESGAEIQQWIAAGERARQENKFVEARTLFNRALLDPRSAESDRDALRQLIGELNESLIFSPAVAKGDPLTDSYSVQSGDLLIKIAARQGLGVDYRFIQRINKMTDAGRLSVGQKLKLVRGPFHGVVHKSAFRLDIYAGPPPPPTAAKAMRPDGTEPDWVFIKSFKVGLGEHGLTPIGGFVVKPRSKMIDPPWTNPRTGEKFPAKDPKNPIGNRWLGLEGTDDQTRPFTGYGIHGTIDPSSIGKEMSMGCVRMGTEDIVVVWEMLQEGVSTVRVVP